MNACDTFREHLTAAELPQQPAVDRAQANITRSGAGVTIVQVVENPAKFARREHRVQRQPGLFQDQRFMTLRMQLRA